MQLAAGLNAIVRALREPNFGLYTAGNAISLLGNWMQRVAVAWLAWELTHSGAWLGIVAFADLFPTIVVAPFAGAAADRWSRLRVVQTAQILALAQSLLLFGLSLAGHLTIWPLLLLTFFLGTTQAVDQPARLALIPSLVSPRELSAAIAINSIIFNVARFIGPAIAGFIIVASGVTAAFGANALTFVVYLIALFRMRPASAAAVPEQASRFIADMAEGIIYTVRHPGVGPLLLLMVIVTTGGRPVAELLPGFADQMFASGPAGLATLTSSLGAGAVVGGLMLAMRPAGAGLTRLVLATSLLLAFTLAAFVATRNPWIAVPALALGGFCMSAGGISVQTMLLMAVEPRFRGRVISLCGMILRGGPAIGAVLMGFMSVKAGLRLPILLGAFVVLLAWLWAYLRRTRIEEALERATGAADGKPTD